MNLDAALTALHDGTGICGAARQHTEAVLRALAGEAPSAPSPRVLRLSCEDQPDGRVKIVILEQKGWSLTSPIIQAWTATNGVILLSVNYPEWQPKERKLYVHGTDSSMDLEPLYVSPTDADLIRAACREWVERGT